MKDEKLITLKLKIIASYEDRVPPVQRKLLQAASSAATDDDVKEDGDDDDEDELEEGEIREDEEVRDDDQENISEASKMKICPYPYCRREFINGKALGGHLRIHKEHPSKTKPKIKPKSESSSDPNPARSQDGYPCSVCGKMFASRKAVFGHMRSHPGRAHRGVQDPGSGSGQPVWAGWKGTKKRHVSEVESEAEGNSSPSSSSHHANGGAEDDMMEVDVVGGDDATDGGERQVNNVLPEQEDDQNADEAEILRIMEKKMKEFDEDELYFLQGYFEQLTTKLNPSNHPSCNKPPTFPSLNSNSEQLIPKPNLKDPPNYNKPPNFSSLNSNSEASTSHSSKKQVAVKKKKRRVSVHHQDDKDQEESPWKCNICNKTFNSHQALGGHISSHSKASAGHQRSNNVRLSSESSPEQTSSQRSNNVRPLSESSPEQASLHSSNNVRSTSELSPEKTRSNNDRSSSELLPEQISPEESRNNGDVLGFDLNSMPDEDVD